MGTVLKLPTWGGALGEVQYEQCTHGFTNKTFVNEGVGTSNEIEYKTVTHNRSETRDILRS